MLNYYQICLAITACNIYQIDKWDGAGVDVLYKHIGLTFGVEFDFKRSFGFGKYMQL